MTKAGQAQGLPLQRPYGYCGVFMQQTFGLSGSTSRRGGGATERVHEFVDLRLIGSVILRIPRRVVQVLQQTCELRKEAAGLILALEGIIALDRPRTR